MPHELAAAANAAQPVARVMSIPELFAVIMHFALDIYKPYISDKGSLPKDIRVLGAAVVASHVCAAWRILCIGTPTLWARQIGMIPLAVAEFLTRSGKTQIDIHSQTTRRYVTPWPVLPYIESSRIRRLAWEDTSDDSKRFVQALLEGSLHNLVALDITGVQWASYPTSEGTSALDVPQLIDLSLHDVHLPSMFHAPKLRELSLYNTRLSFAWLLDSLRVSQALEELVLDRCRYDMFVATESQGNPPRIPLFDLPNLRFLDLFDDGAGDASPDAFYQLLDLLSTSSRRLSVALEDGWSDELITLCLRHVFRCYAPSYLYVEGKLEFYPGPNISTPSVPPVIKESDIRAYLGYFSLKQMIKRLPHFQLHQELSNITILVMHTDNAYDMGEDETVVRSMMCALTHVETYWVMNRALDETRWGKGPDEKCCCLWQSLAPELTDDGDKQMPFLRLRVLGLGISVEDPTELLDEICDILTSREDAGITGLDILSFPLIPQPHDDDVPEELFSLSRTVHWDQLRASNPSPLGE